MAKNRNNKKKRNGVVSMDTTDASVSEQPQGTFFTRPSLTLLLSMPFNRKMKQKGRPMKRSKNVRKMKAVAKAVSANEKSVAKLSKNESKKNRLEDLKLLKAVAINKRSVLQRVGAVEGECPVDVNIITDYECHS
ncbi:hypothetical protein JHK85_038273 [Glycine max]|nr:hypothetical protein JHK85_038273 [Glycine max]